MKLIEIDTKYYRLLEGVKELLEKYSSPSTELNITFKKISTNDDVLYYEGVVKDISSCIDLLRIIFYVSKLNPNAVSIENVYPLTISPEKLTHTSLGPQQGTGLDMGYTAMKWLFSEVKNFAASLGFKIKQVISSTRFTGARAKNNPNIAGDILPKEFNVDLVLKEMLIYDCDTDTLRVSRE
jgi:hypothetical protein